MGVIGDMLSDLQALRSRVERSPVRILSSLASLFPFLEESPEATESGGALPSRTLRRSSRVEAEGGERQSQRTKSPGEIQNKGFLYAVFLLTLFCPLLSEMLLSSAAPAENPKEEYQKIQKEMEVYKGKLEETRKREHSVLEEIDTVDKRLDIIETELNKQRSVREQTEAQL
ncbi:MAG: hypothetical protein ABR903_05910, partial [Thermodesulfovibrionales bacterium]